MTTHGQRAKCNIGVPLTIACLLYVNTVDDITA